MFTKFKHTPEEDIKLFANPYERRALEKVLKRQTEIRNAEAFIEELHDAILEQASRIETINKVLQYRHFHEEDACISGEQHLSDMCQTDVDKVFRHLHALFVVRNSYWVMVDELDHHLSDGRKSYIYNRIIVPWLHWVRSAKKNKSDTAKESASTTANKAPDNNITKVVAHTTTTTGNTSGSVLVTFADTPGALASGTWCA